MKAKPTYQELEKRVQELELRSSAMSDASFEAIFLSDKGVCLDQNKTAERMFGYTRDEAVGRHGTEWIVSEDRERVREKMLSGYEKSYKVTALRKDGTTFSCEIQARMIDFQGRSIRITALRDLTERKENERALRESERRFREMAENIREVFWVFDWREKRVLYVSPTYEEVWERSTKALLENYKEWAESIHPDDREDANESFLRIVESGESESREYRIVRPDGTVRWVSDRGFAVYGNDGKVHRIVGIAEDITSQKDAEQELRASEEKFSMAFHSSPDAIAISRISDGQILEVNEGFINSTGYRRNELIGRTTIDLGLWADQNDRQHFVQMMAEKGCMRECEYRLRGKSGKVRDGLLSGKVIQIGPEKCLLVIIRDVTDQKKAEKALLENQQLLEEAQAMAHMGSWEWDVRTNANIWSDEMFRIFGHEPGSVIPNYDFFASALHPEDRDRILSAVQRAVDMDMPYAEEYRIILPDESERVVFANGKVRRDENTSEVRMVGTVLDITERKRAEEELRKSHQTFLTVLDGIDATIYVADMDTHEILFMNKYMTDLFGANLTGQICYEVFRKENSVCDYCTNDRLLDTDGNPTEVCTWETQNPITGNWYINYDRAIRWIDGRMVRLQIATDITRLKELEQERIQAEMQLRQAQKMESVGRLAGGVAHDFNNMLGVIIGHAELALEQVNPSLPMHAYLMEIYNAARRSAGLTRQLLAFARKQTILPRVLDLNDTITGMLKMLRRLIGEDIDLDWSPGANLWPVKIDPAQIDQILANLFVNARDAITGTGKITVGTKNVVFDQLNCTKHEGLVPGEYVMLVVSDDGCGIDKETLDKLFEPFFTTKEVGEGTGLGLSTVYGIVKQNDGYIYVHSKPGEGATLKIYFPRKLAVVETKGESVGKKIKKGTETVLLVEDEPSFLSLGKTVLERFGYLVLAARTPSEALAMAQHQEGPIDLLITDVVMPEMNGKELEARVKKLKPNIRVLFMSGYTPNAVIHRGVLENSTDFLPKPFSVSSLTSKVREILDRQE